MKTIIAGSRRISDMDVLERAIASSGFQITHVISGGAQGIDLLAQKWAAANKLPCRVFDPQWKVHGAAAGPLRNRLMAEAGEALIAVPDGDSRGTWDMVRKAKKRGLPVYIHNQLSTSAAVPSAVREAPRGRTKTSGRPL